jgi:hypothetical protein
MLNLPLDRLLGSLGETVMMTAVSGAISFAVGLPLGLVLVGTAQGGVWENRWINKVVGAIVNGFRSLPFIILLVALIPLTRLIVGTSIGTAAAIVPLSISGIPYFGRVSEAALREVDGGMVEAVRAMGGGNHYSRGAGAGGAAKSDRRLYRHLGASHRRFRYGGRRRRGRAWRSRHSIRIPAFRDIDHGRSDRRSHRACRACAGWRRQAGEIRGPPMS